MAVRLTIDERRHQLLQLRAKALRISEEELLRRAIDALLTEPPVAPSAPDRSMMISELLEAARRLSASRAGAEPYRFHRDELYEEREGRWSRAR